MGHFVLRRWIVTFWASFSVISFMPQIALSQRGNSNECNTIDAAFYSTGLGGPYFLSKGEYIEYSTNRESEAKVGPITELGFDPRSSDPDAAFTLPNDTLLIIKGCQYFRYVLGGDNLWTLQNEGQNFGGLPCSPDAALTTWNGNVTAFKDCNIWTYSNVTQTFNYIGDLPDMGLPCTIDAAVQLGAYDTIYIKGLSYWRFSDDALQGPYHTDSLNLCSWYLCGEADWMGNRNRGQFPCNGDERLCNLRLNQVTLPGLHNAGSGFHGGFLFLDCWLRNHANSIEQQLERGIRYLDIDPSFRICGVLGSHHSSFCGGSICRILKQTRSFLSNNPHEVIVINFNHEMQDADLVMPALTRQLESQLGPMLNKGFRLSRQRRWPKLRQAVRSNRRVFVFYAPEVQDAPFRSQVFRPNLWINSERWLASTWTEFYLSNGNCSEIVPRTEAACYYRQARAMLEVSVVPTNLDTCIYTTASACTDYHHAMLRACETYRFSRGRSPNVLMVDYPEVEPESPNSVFNAVYHQNVRNIMAHRGNRCQVRIDAAVRRPSDSDQVLFFVGSKVLIYSHSYHVQIQEITIPGVSYVDAAYVSDDGDIIVVKGCQSLALDSSSLSPQTTNWTDITGCESPVNAMAVWEDMLWEFRGCSITSQGQGTMDLTQLGLPCNPDAALSFIDHIFVFYGETFWRRREGETTFTQGETLDWTIDAVVCS